MQTISTDPNLKEKLEDLYEDIDMLIDNHYEVLKGTYFFGPSIGYLITMMFSLCDDKEKANELLMTSIKAALDAVRSTEKETNE